MWSELVRRNYESWIDDEELEKVYEVLDSEMERCGINEVRYLDCGENGYYVMKSERKGYLLCDGVSESIEGLILEIEGICLMELDEVEKSVLRDMIECVGEVEVDVR